MDFQTSKTHYVCPGTCGGVSDQPKDCEDKSCSFYNQPLHECSCDDGMHRQDIPANPAAQPA